ncbi:MAG: LysR family transcriptional regulator [Parasporobacterium sp.]|nr:LysR family transcriptional regulator [Parasporobacterium sp.]
MYPEQFADISIHQLNIFLVCAKYENFSKAAEELFMTQSTVSRNIADLEEKTGLMLFVRQRQRVRLTKAGAQLAGELEKLSFSFQKAYTDAAAVQDAREKTLYIGDMDTMPAEAYLMPVLQRFEKKYPGIEIQVSRSNPQNILDGLYQQQYDAIFFVAIGQERFRHSEFVYVPVTTATPVVIIGAGHPLYSAPDPGIRDLEGCPFLRLQNKYQDEYWKRICQYFAQAGFAEPEVKYVDNPHSMVLELSRGNYAAVMDRMFASGYDSLRTIEMPDCPRLNGIGVVYNQHTDKASVREFVRCTQEIAYSPLYIM